MHFPTLITTLTSLLTIAMAVPVVAREASLQRIPKPSKSINPQASPSHSQSASPTMSPVGAYSCPQKQHKACCQSLQQTSKEIMKPVGELVPIVGGLEISSAVSFQCNHMDENEAPDSCKGNGYTPMCCSSQVTQGSLNQCKPFEKAKTEYYKSFGYGQESTVDVINDSVS
ncbi:hypothetical protein N7512_003130 [Penicillium capsulatum]|nr:hypothetical protein N7512_003130 [Penicillium capsulatum]